MGAKLDRSRAFGEVFGASGIRFIQDGQNFDASGALIAAGEAPEPAPTAEDPQQAKKGKTKNVAG